MGFTPQYGFLLNITTPGYHIFHCVFTKYKDEYGPSKYGSTFYEFNNTQPNLYIPFGKKVMLATSSIERINEDYEEPTFKMTTSSGPVSENQR